VTAFPWLFTILLLVLVAWLVLTVCETGACAVRERRLRLTRPTLRVILAVTIVELGLLLAWGLFLRPR
jgi:hypothetical protein